MYTHTVSRRVLACGRPCSPLIRDRLLVLSRLEVSCDQYKLEVSYLFFHRLTTSSFALIFSILVQFALISYLDSVDLLISLLSLSLNL